MDTPEFKNLMKHFNAEGIAGIETHLAVYPDKNNDNKDHKLKLLESIRKAIGSTYIANKTLDSMHEIYEACIVEALAIANEDEALIEYANVTSYNLAANLADCWSDAEEPRSDKHFEAGVFSAKRCLDLRKKLNKPPASFAMAYFVLGVHEYSLNHYSKSEEAWANKLKNDSLCLEKSTEAETDLNSLLSHGLIALARWSQGAESLGNYDESILRLNAMRTTNNAGEVDLFIDELRLLKEKHGPSQ